MPSVLFVCLGNICRSPMCEAVFTQMVKERGLEQAFQIDSAGTAGYHIGDAPDSRTVAVCTQQQVPVNHRARQIQVADFDRFEYIFCMDESNLQNVRRLRPDGSRAQVQLFGDFHPDAALRIIEDPYYGPLAGFELNFKQARACSEAFLKSLGY